MYISDFSQETKYLVTKFENSGTDSTLMPSDSLGSSSANESWPNVQTPY